MMRQGRWWDEDMLVLPGPAGRRFTPPPLSDGAKATSFADPLSRAPRLGPSMERDPAAGLSDYGAGPPESAPRLGARNAAASSISDRDRRAIESLFGRTEARIEPYAEISTSRKVGHDYFVACT